MADDSHGSNILSNCRTLGHKVGFCASFVLDFTKFLKNFDNQNMECYHDDIVLYSTLHFILVIGFFVPLHVFHIGKSRQETKLSHHLQIKKLQRWDGRYLRKFFVFKQGNSKHIFTFLQWYISKEWHGFIKTSLCIVDEAQTVNFRNAKKL